MADKVIAGKLKRKDYEKELRKLEVELCHLDKRADRDRLRGA